MDAGSNQHSCAMHSSNQDPLLLLWSAEEKVRLDRLTRRAVFAVLWRAENFLAKYGTSSYKIGLN
jgi:hypothetical protein